jgi:Xaa-Pro aminopeptidase
MIDFVATNADESEAAGIGNGVRAELDEKLRRVRTMLEERDLDGVLVSGVRNVEWLTAGRVNTRIVTAEETGVGSLLVMRDDRRYLVADNIEMPRFKSEALAGLGYDALEFNWYEGSMAACAQEATGARRIGCDVSADGLTKVDFAPLRYSLTDAEVARYRTLCAEAAGAVVRVCHAVSPGMSEHEIAAITANELMHGEINPTVLLVGTDERIYNFRHPVPTGKKLERYCMIVVCAERHGLVAAVTRLVHFGEVPQELKTKIRCAARVHATMQAHTIPGAKSGDIFRCAQDEYAAAGFDGEWQHHHQAALSVTKSVNGLASRRGARLCNRAKPSPGILLYAGLKSKTRLSLSTITLKF